MTQVALMAPTTLLPHVQPLSKYHLVLAYKVIYDRKYQEYCARRSKEGDYIILDNGAVEKGGKSIPMKDIVLAALLIKPSLIVLPDFLFDSLRTLDETENALRSPHMKFLKRVHPSVKICTIVQGVDEEDWLECFNILNDTHNGIDVLGVPKITGQVFGSRLNVLKKISKKVKKPCHLFGVWWKTTLEEIGQEGQFDFVQGLDTPKPVRLAVNGLELKDWAKMPRGKDFLDRSHNGVDLELLRRNCEQFIELVNGGNNAK